MKYFILLLLLSGSVFSQKHVYNVQQYCIDDKPFQKGQCDIKGNEYSFVFVDPKKKEVAFFLTDIKYKYKIVEILSDKKSPEYEIYTLQNEQGIAEMRVNKSKTKMEFIYPESHVYLKVGKSTKME